MRLLPGACGRSSASRWLPGTKRRQPFVTVASDTASQHVAVAVSAVHGGQYAISWCLHDSHCPLMRIMIHVPYIAACIRAEPVNQTPIAAWQTMLLRTMQRWRRRRWGALRESGHSQSPWTRLGADRQWPVVQERQIRQQNTPTHSEVRIRQSVKPMQEASCSRQAYGMLLRCAVLSNTCKAGVARPRAWQRCSKTLPCHAGQ